MFKIFTFMIPVFFVVFILSNDKSLEQKSNEVCSIARNFGQDVHPDTVEVDSSSEFYSNDIKFVQLDFQSGDSLITCRVELHYFFHSVGYYGWKVVGLVCSVTSGTDTKEFTEMIPNACDLPGVLKFQACNQTFNMKELSYPACERVNHEYEHLLDRIISHGRMLWAESEKRVEEACERVHRAEEELAKARQDSLFNCLDEK
jgi:hypothetical protein